MGNVILIMLNNKEQGYQGEFTEWILEKDEDGNIKRIMISSSKK